MAMEILSVAVGGSEAKQPKEYSIWNGDELPCDRLPYYNNNDENYKWYFMVFKPLNSNYDKDYNAIDFIRKLCTKNSEAWIIAKEVNATKVHWNALIYTSENLSKFHDRRLARFMVWSKVTNDPHEVYWYITKEYYHHGMPWILYRDFNFKFKNIFLTYSNDPEKENFISTETVG